MQASSTQLNTNGGGVVVSSGNSGKTCSGHSLYCHTEYLERRRHSLAPETIKIKTPPNTNPTRTVNSAVAITVQTHHYPNAVISNNSNIKYNSYNNLRVPTEYNKINVNNNRRFSTSSALHATINNGTIANTNVASAHNSQIVAIDSKIEQAMVCIIFNSSLNCCQYNIFNFLIF